MTPTETHADDPTALYIHVPFCTGKCSYCGFYSICPSGDQVARTLDAMRAEAEMIVSQCFDNSHPTISSLFIGGGTPTFLSPSQIATLLKIVDDCFVAEPLWEASVETSPETVTPEKVQAFVDGGINRFSLGAQSFNDRLLERIGRRHRGADTFAALDAIRAAGVENFNIDLIYGLPGQSLDDWRADLATAIDLEPSHLACYELVYEDDTPMASDTSDRLDDDTLTKMFYSTKDTLESAGFEHYEISNYALPQRRCRHNERYWRNESYIGLGPSATGYIDRARYTNVRDVDAYCRAVLVDRQRPVAQVEHADRLLRAGETAMLNLRTARGIIRQEFIARTGCDPYELYADQLTRLSAARVIETDSDCIRLSRRGLIVANEVMAEFLP